MFMNSMFHLAIFEFFFITQSSKPFIHQISHIVRNKRTPPIKCFALSHQNMQRREPAEGMPTNRLFLLYTELDSPIPTHTYT